MEQIYRIADHTILIRTMYERMHREAADYAASGCVDFTIETTQTDIDAERAQSVRTDAAEGRTATAYSDAYLETLAVYRKIAERMPDDGTVLFHGSAIAVDGAAYLFTAKSGTGKSTHARLWCRLLGDRAIMINDDKPLVRILNGGAVIYGTPWSGKHRLNTNCAVPLKAVCVLERAEQNSIHRITAAEAYPFLLQQIYRPSEASAAVRTVQLIEKLPGSVDLWRLGCNMELEAAQIAYGAMKG
jgi:hypothetical protein